MKSGKAAVDACGFVASHAEVFKKIAKELNTVVSSRDLNKASPGLLDEDYAAKGFHIKAKSCDFGPMAGFVCWEPSFSKLGPNDSASQEKENKASIGHGCKKVHLVISKERLDWLLKEKRCELDTTQTNSDDRKHLWCKPSWAQSELTFVADRTLVPKEWASTGKGHYALFYTPLADTKKPWNEMLQATLANPLHGLANATNPEAGPQPKDFHAAVAGDYDLFSLWPHLNSDEWTDRPVDIAPEVVNKAAKKSEFVQKWLDAVKGDIKKENKHMGNISLLLVKARNKLNAGITQSGYKGGNVVHHSDDSGNPFSKAPTWPLLFFIPGKEPDAVENVGEFKTYIKKLEDEGYVVKLNPKWVL
jgi:hypothetical protein